MAGAYPRGVQGAISIWVVKQTLSLKKHASLFCPRVKGNKKVLSTDKRVSLFSPGFNESIKVRTMDKQSSLLC